MTKVIRSIKRPSTGKIYEVRYTQPVLDLRHQNERHEDYFRHGGDVGNDEHLLGKGDHTPWSAGKLPGWIYAKDTWQPRDFEEWLVAKCRDRKYDTTWIDFFNVDYSQYDNAGNRLQSSGDGHLHISVARGHEYTHVTLFDDYVKWKEGGDMPTVEEFWNHKIASKGLKKTTTAADWLKAGAATGEDVKKLTTAMLAASAADETRDRATLAAITALTDALKAGSGTRLDAAVIVDAIRAEGEKTRDEVTARATNILAKLREATEG